jgi:methylglutaconyl-CoA hydratase
LIDTFVHDFHSHSFISHIIRYPKGAALGGGLEIALTADIIVAGSKALFGAPETGLAIIPGAGGTQRLPRLIGTARAKDLIYTARRIDGKTAHEYGIVQYLVPAGSSDGEAMRLAERISQNGPIALRAAKQSIDEGMECDTLNDAMEVEKACYQKVLSTKDRIEGLTAFKEKRKPNYKGF